MSFSSDVKSELCTATNLVCCRLAECYGILLFNRNFSYNKIALLTEHEQVAKRCVYLIKSVFSVSATIQQIKALNGMYQVSVENEMDRKKLMLGFGFRTTDLVKSINRDIITRDCCAASFIRGAFLACGSISDPNKEYHAEFSISDFLLADSFYQLLRSRGLRPRKSLRERNNVVYFKETGSIEDLLTMTGASGYTLQLMEVKIYKDMRNKVNRINNCETANISKTVDAVIAHKNAINKLISAGKFEHLPQNLRDAAELRLQYPEASLAQLVELSGGTITRSGINHRLRRIVELAEDL